jgi:hypothetical protein
MLIASRWEMKAVIDANLEYAKRLLSEQWQQPKKYGRTQFRSESVSVTFLDVLRFGILTETRQHYFAAVVL